jgi:hypothetical protein
LWPFMPFAGGGARSPGERRRPVYESAIGLGEGCRCVDCSRWVTSHAGEGRSGGDSQSYSNRDSRGSACSGSDGSARRPPAGCGPTGRGCAGCGGGVGMRGSSDVAFPVGGNDVTAGAGGGTDERDGAGGAGGRGVGGGTWGGTGRGGAPAGGIGGGTGWACPGTEGRCGAIGPGGAGGGPATGAGRGGGTGGGPAYGCAADAMAGAGPGS